MKLHEICEVTGMTRRNVHYYISEGLLSPAQDPQNGYYDFAEDDKARLLMIRSFRNAGFSISQIRAVLQTPSTSVYYMNQRLKQVRSDLEHLKALESALSFMQRNLPIHPDFSDLEVLTRKANIPSPDIASDDPDEEIKENDLALVNRFLWESFLPESPLSEYQEFLWSKINRSMAGDCKDDYRRISATLHSLSVDRIRNLFSDTRIMHKKVIDLTESGYESHVEEMKTAIRRFLSDPRSVRNWNSQYKYFVAPSARLYDSGMADIMSELSPLFASYRRNVNAVCKQLYLWLHSEEGNPLLDLMNRSLGDCFDIECCRHGQLEAMAVFNRDL